MPCPKAETPMSTVGPASLIAVGSHVVLIKILVSWRELDREPGPYTLSRSSCQAETRDHPGLGSYFYVRE
jgi:hypothetical protein